MSISKRTAAALLTTSALAGSATTAVTALADHGDRGRGGAHREDGRRMVVLSTSLVPSVPTDPSLLGVAAGGVPWVLRSGEVQLRGSGRLTIRIRGLLIPSGQFAGTTGP